MKSLFLTIIITLGLTSCATNKPINDSTSVLEVKNIVLKLDGDSDAKSAGKINSVNFAYDSSSLDENAKDILHENSEYMKLNQPITVQIEGHCDERGGRQYNLALGERRAITVRNYMRGQGASADRMKIISLGNERPLVTGDSAQARAKNRRANFVILSK